MALKIYNTLSRSLEEFTPISDVVGLYTCGPTVYNYPHIGNYRAYIFGDILKRHLRYSGYTVKHVMNITDVDDKIIRDSVQSGKTLKGFTEFYTEGFYKDMESLHLVTPDVITKATDYIKEMLKLTERLVANGYAYTTADGSAYFSLPKDAQYGKLSHFHLSDLKENADGRIKKDEYDKDNAQDFALWKGWDETDGAVFWNPSEILGNDTKLGKGRPGWHIECSAMSIAELGESFDIHTGGVDLIFPHHENEIAQSECATGKQFVKYWMHNEHLMVDGKKMSKSLGNFYTLRDLMEKGFEPLAFRYLMYSSHYRTKTNFTLEALEASATALKRLTASYSELLDETTGNIDSTYKDRIIVAVNEDLDTPKALSILWELVHDTTLSKQDKKATMLDFDNIFGFGFANVKKDSIPDEIMAIVKEREQARLDKDWAKSDELRKKINEIGYEVKDTENGSTVIKI